MISFVVEEFRNVADTEDKSRPGLCLKAAAHLFSEAGLQGSQIEVMASFLQFLGWTSLQMLSFFGEGAIKQFKWTICFMDVKPLKCGWYGKSGAQVVFEPHH